MGRVVLQAHVLHEALILIRILRRIAVARAMWKGSIAFGLVNIPIELYTAVRDHRPKFRLLHAKDESPVSYERVCQSEGKPVGWEDLVKGYEYEKGQFVVLSKDDFKTAAPAGCATSGGGRDDQGRDRPHDDAVRG